MFRVTRWDVHARSAEKRHHPYCGFARRLFSTTHFHDRRYTIAIAIVVRPGLIFNCTNVNRSWVHTFLYIKRMIFVGGPFLSLKTRWPAPLQGSCFTIAEQQLQFVASHFKVVGCRFEWHPLQFYDGRWPIVAAKSFSRSFAVCPYRHAYYDRLTNVAKQSLFDDGWPIVRNDQRSILLPELFEVASFAIVERLFSNSLSGRCNHVLLYDFWPIACSDPVFHLLNK